MANNKNKNKVLDVQNLSVNYNSGGAIFRAVKNVSFSVNEGETISIVGESGSGKSTTAAALIGLLPHATGNVVLKDYTIPAAPHFIKKGFNNWMAEQMQFVFQDPFTSLNPRARVERILREPFRTNNPFKAERKEAIQKMFHQINLLLIKSLNLKNKDRENKLIDRANVLHEDRVKLIHEAKEEIDLDEYKIKNFKAEIWQVKNTMRTKLARFSDLALENQRKVEKENLDELLSKDNKEYEEYKAALKIEAQEEIEALKKEREIAKRELHIAKQKRQEVKKRLAIERKEFEDLINKFSVSTTADSPIWNVRRNKVTKTESGWQFDKTLSFRNLFKGGLIDAYDFMWIKSHLNPIYKRSRFIKKELESIISDFFNNYSRINIKRRVRERIQDKLEEVGLNGSDILKYPADFSGGQRQRIAIARAMMTEPALIIADEPISSLDVSIQAQIINLLKDLRASHNLTLVFIAHDLRMVEYISDNIAVMSKGQIVEYGKTKEVFKNPTHPYTRSLLSSIPSINTINLRLKVLEYDASKYQNEGLDLKEISLSDNHKVLSTDEWIKQWKAEAKKFVVYENTSRSQVKVKK